MTATQHVLFWTIEDPDRGCRYRARIAFHYDQPDAGDGVTPPYAGGVVLRGLEVIQGEMLDDAGDVRQVVLGDHARLLDNRAWQVVQHDPMVREELQQQCAEAV